MMFRTIQKGPLARLANPHRNSSSAVTAGGSASFKTGELEVADNKIFSRYWCVCPLSTIGKSKRAISFKGAEYCAVIVQGV